MSPLSPCGRQYLTAEEAETAAGARAYKAGQLAAEGRPVAEYVVLSHGSHFHVREAGAGVVQLRPGDTGPDPATRQAVRERDGFACVCCGTSIIGRPSSTGHRKRRSQGGTNSLSNLLTFLGYGDGRTADDHHWRIDKRIDPMDELHGYTVRRAGNPLLVSVMYFERDGSGLERYLHDDGSLEAWPEVAA